MTVDITTSTPDEVLAAVREMEALNPRSLNARMGIEVIEASAERLVATMPVEGNTQPYGLLHGGASVVLAESLGSIGSALHAGPDKVVVGVDINATHTRSATSGWVTGTCVPLHTGRSLMVHEIICRDDDGNRLSTVRITNMVKELPAS